MSSDANQPNRAQHGATGRNNKKMAIEYILDKSLETPDLSQRQLQAVELLLRGLSDAEIAAQLNVDRGTVYRWRTSPRFLRELERQRKVLFEQSAARLQALIAPSLEILHRQLTGDDPRTALRAAAILLRVATPSRLARFVEQDQPTQPSQRSPEPAPDDDTWERIQAYVEAPLPGQPGAPTRGPFDDELDDDEDDDEDDPCDAT